MQAQNKPDNRQNRSDATRNSLMRAAEKLIAEHGLANVTIKDILVEADQKNTSALQYHFKNLQGLVKATHAERSREIQNQRAELLGALLKQTDNPSLREICTLMIKPVFELAATRVDFRRYVKAFGHELALSESSALSEVQRQGGGGTSGQELNELLQNALTHLDRDAYRRRLESAVRLCSASIFHQARQKNAFRGPEADLFLNSLIDALVGLLSAPESPETRAAVDALTN